MSTIVELFVTIIAGFVLGVVAIIGFLVAYDNHPNRRSTTRSGVAGSAKR